MNSHIPIRTWAPLVLSRGITQSRLILCCSSVHHLSRLWQVSLVPPCRVQGGRGGHDFRHGREQPRHGMGAGGSPVRLQPKVQQAGQRRVPHALRPHLPEAVSACPLGCAPYHSLSPSMQMQPTADDPHLYVEEKVAHSLSLDTYLPHSQLVFSPV